MRVSAEGSEIEYWADDNYSERRRIGWRPRPILRLCELPFRCAFCEKIIG